MNDFTASNGIAIRTKDGDLDFKRPDTYGWLGLCGGDVVDALREFFQAEADERVGRWRWPENPDYVVYQREGYPAENARRVRVILEPTGDFVDTVEGSKIDGPFKDAARAYFDAHPEPKPWHDAEPGEVWELTVEGVTRTYASIASAGQNDVYVRFFPTHAVNAVTVGTKAPVISAGRRVFPEVAS